jgi:hypothetical protein
MAQSKHNLSAEHSDTGANLEAMEMGAKVGWMGQ